MIIDNLRLEVRSCKKCPLHKVRECPILDKGDIRSPLMIVVESPTQSDDKNKELLSGKFGKRLDTLLTLASVDPDKVYKTSLLKCFKGIEPTTDKSYQKCFNYLADQIKIITPRVIILSGVNTLYWALLRDVKSKPELIDDYLNIMYRRQDIYKDIRFFAIPEISQIGRDKEDAIIQILKSTKDFISAKQQDKPFDCSPIDLIPPTPHQRNEQPSFFKFIPPT